MVEQHQMVGAPAAAPRAAVVGRAELLAEGIAAMLREEGIQAQLVEPEQLGSLDGVDVVVCAEWGAGFTATLAAARRAHPEARIVAVVPAAEANTIDGAVRAGAAGVLDVRAGSRELGLVVSRVAEGRRVLPLVVSDIGGKPGRTLSHRQLDVLRLIAEGRSNHEIARELMITVNTVKFHVRSIFRELGIHNRVEAVRAWERIGSAYPVG